MSKHKKGLFKVVLLYFVIGTIAYGVVDYMNYAINGGYGQVNNYEKTTPVVQNDQELMSASANLDSTNVNDLDAGINQNTTDANTF
jgi:hypothetical protein